MTNSLPSIRSRSLLAGCILALAAGGCVGETTGPGASSQFEATLTGDLEATFSGRAYFADAFQQTEDGAQLRFFLIELQDFDGDEMHLIRISRPGWGTPAAGTYQIGGDGTLFTGSYFRMQDAGQTVEVEADAVTGTLTITQVGERHLRGTFTFQAVGEQLLVPDLPGRPVQFTVSGSFAAAVAGR
jgi:hypothetical protein